MNFKKMGRRIFVMFLSFAILITGAICSLQISNASNDEKSITFTVFSDFHYEQGKWMTSIPDLESILKRANNTNSSFVMSTGDFSNDIPDSPELITAFHSNSYNLPTYNIIGNHEMEFAALSTLVPTLTDSTVTWGNGTTSATGPNDLAYYYFDTNGFRVICLDTNYYCKDSTDAENESQWVHYEEGVYSPSIEGGYNNGLNPAQVTWLEEVVNDAAESGTPCIVMSHHNISNKFANNSVISKKVHTIFSEANKTNPGTVLMVISGHRHTDNFVVEDNVLYFDLNSTRTSYWRQETSHHYTDAHTYTQRIYNDAGTSYTTNTSAKLKDLSHGMNTWYSEDPLSAVVTVSTNGVINVEGTDSDWIYDVVPDVSSETKSVITPDISSGTFYVGPEDQVVSCYYSDISLYRATSGFTAPEMNGYVFAGWFTSSDLETAIAKTTKTGAAYAKFVPEELLSVKAQVNNAALSDNITDTNKAAIRLLTSVDSLKYSNVGFVITRADDSGYLREYETNKVAEKISYVSQVGGATNQISASELFGPCAMYFSAYAYSGIPESDVNVEITATPYWITLDGTTVEGTKSVKTVDKGRSWIYVDAAANADGKQYGTKAHPYTDITTASKDILLKSGGKIRILNDMEITKRTIIENVNATVQSYDIANPVTLYGTVNSYMFDVMDTGTLGLSHVVIDGRAKEIATSDGETERTSQMIRNQGTIIADNTTIQYGNSMYSGGAVWNLGTLKATNCEFNNNVVTFMDTEDTTIRGGAIYNTVNATAEIEDTLFQNNAVSTTAAGSYVYGGAIYSKGSLTVTDCQFVENTSTTSASSDTVAHGGAVYIDGSNLSEGDSAPIAKFVKDDGEAYFSGNVASNWGGAIVLSETQLDNVTVEGYTFKEANSAGNGGAVYLVGAGAKLDGATFSANTTTGGGGAIFAKESSTLEIANSTLESNTAGSRGGAIYANASAITLSGTTKFSTNSVTGGALTGGAVYAINGSLDIEEASNVTFNKNKGASTGGALHLENVATDMKAKATFSGNTATSKGGAIYAKSNKVSITGAEFNGNTVSSSTSNVFAGAIYVDSNTTVNVVDTLLESNTATIISEGYYAYGGAIFSKGTLTADDCQFKTNKSTTTLTSGSAGHGGAVYVDGANAVATFEKNDGEAYFSGNVASNWGGAIVLSSTALNNVTIDGYTFKETNSAGNGGALYLAGAGAKVDGVTFTGNTTTGGGGAVYAKESSTLQVVSSTFTSNTAGTNGGAMFLKNSTATLSGTTEFVSNSLTATDNYGGAIYNENGSLTINAAATVNFTGNSAAKAGAVCVNGASAVFKNEETGTAKFEENKSSSWGGAILLLDTLKENVVIDGYSFIENASTSGDGGAIYLRKNASEKVEATISNTTFTSNSAAGGGGAVFVNGTNYATGGSELQITDSTFTGNYAPKKGGAMYIQTSAVVTMADTIFNGNHATSTSSAEAQGGAIYSAGTLTATDCQFTSNMVVKQNTGAAKGGAVYIDGASAVATFNKTENGTAKFDGNTAANWGGAIVLINTTKANVVIDGYTFSGNVSSGDGGAIYMRYEVGAQIKNAKFENNTGNGGGAIFAKGEGAQAQLSVADCTFEKNTGRSKGGAMYLNNAVAELTGELTFSENTCTNGADIYNTGTTLTYPDGLNITIMTE